MHYDRAPAGQMTMDLAALEDPYYLKLYALNEGHLTEREAHQLEVHLRECGVAEQVCVPGLREDCMLGDVRDVSSQVIADLVALDDPYYLRMYALNNGHFRQRELRQLEVHLHESGVPEEVCGPL